MVRTLKSKLLCFLVTCLSFPAVSQPITYDWAANMGGNLGYGTLIDIARDEAGNTYVYGEFYGTRNFGSQSLTSTGFNDVFLSKYSSSGTCMWTVKGGGANGVALSGGITYFDGFLFIAGQFNGTFTMGSYNLTSNGGNDIFMAGLDTTGFVAWLNKTGGPGDDGAYGITYSPSSGDLYTCGRFAGTVAFGGNNLATSSNGDQDIYLARYDLGGNNTWAVKAGGLGPDIAHCVRELPNGTIALSGMFSGTSYFSGNPITALALGDMFIANYSNTGFCNWVQKASSRGNDIAYSIGYDNASNSYITGFIGDTCFFGSLFVPDNGYGSVITAKYNSQGNFQWVKSGTSFNPDNSYDIATDTSGSSYVIGYVGGNANFGTGNVLSGVQGIDVFIIKYSTTGSVVWLTKISGSGADLGRAIAFASNGDFVIAGETGSPTLTFGTQTVTTPAGIYSTFIASMGGGTVSIEEPTELQLSLFPNPVTSELYIRSDWGNDLIRLAEIVSVDGKVVYSKELHRSEGDESKLGLSGLAAGQYLLKLNTSSGVYSKPILINR